MGEQVRLGPVLARHRSIRALFTAQCFSLLAVQTSRVLVPTMAVRAHASVIQVAAISVAEYLPGVVLTPLIGLAADRHPARTILLACDALRALVLGAAAVYAWRGGPGLIGVLIGAALLVGAVSALFDVTAATVVPRTIPPDQPRIRAVATSGVASLQYLGLILGPTLGGAIAQVLRGGAGLLATTVLFVGSLVALPGVRVAPGEGPGDRPGDRPAERRTRWGGSTAGIRFAWRSPTLRTVVGGAGLFNFGGNAIGALFLLFLYRTLGLGPAIAGVSFALNGAALLLGVRLAPRAVARWGTWPVIRAGALACAAAIVLIPLAPAGATGAVVILVYQAAFGVGAGCWALAMSLVVQRVTPEQMLGRVNATLRAVSTGAAPAGAALAGVLASVAGVRTAIAGFAAVVVLAAALYAVQRPNLERPGPPLAPTA